MELIIRGLVVYAALFLLMRAAGNRQFSKLTAFDAVLIILIAEVTGQALVGEDYSVTGALVVLVTLVGVDVAVSLAKRRWQPFAKAVDGIPTLIVDRGTSLQGIPEKERVDVDDILAAAREMQGLERLEDVKYAVLEPDGKISIIPWPEGERPRAA